MVFGLEINPLTRIVFPRLKKNVENQIYDQKSRTVGFDWSKPLWQKAQGVKEVTASRSSRVQGDLYLNNLRKYIRIFPTLTTHQYTFSELYTQALLPYLYGEDFKNHELRIKIENNIEQLYQFALVCCPRRFGKTLFTAWYAACCMIAKPGITVTVFSPGKRPSGMFMKLVKKYVVMLMNTVDREITINKGENNQEIFSIVIDGEETSLLRVLPANIDTVRGVGGDLIICEEAAAMSKEFIESVVLPVVGVSKTAMICISTIQLEDAAGLPNWYTTLIGLRNQRTGQPLFNVYQFTLACDDCIRAGTVGSCKHKASELPDWHDEVKQSVLKIVYDAFNAGRRQEAELMGFTQSKALNAFAPSHVHHTFNEKFNPRFELRNCSENQWNIFISVDPSAGGDGSRATLVTALYNKTDMHIVGMESIVSTVALDYETYMLQHIGQIRTFLGLPDARIVMFIENNASGFSRSLRNKVMELYDNVQCCDLGTFTVGNMQLHNGTYKRPRKDKDTGGVHTDGLVKEAMYHRLKESLALRTLHFAKQGLTIYGTSKEINGWEVNIKELKKQMLAFQIKMKVPKPEDLAWNKIKYTYDGKSSGPDDLCIGVMLNLHWSWLYRTNSNDFQTNEPGA